MLVTLHAIYFGLRFGFLAATCAGVLYFINITPEFGSLHWTDLTIRFAFLYLLALPAGFLSEKLKKDKSYQESLAKQLAVSFENLKKMQNKLIETEKYSALGRLTEEIAHEIRNPLTALGGFARRMEKKLATGSVEKEYCTLVVTEVERLEKILRDVLVYSRPNHHPRLARAPLDGLLRETVDRYTSILQVQNISVDIESDAGLPHVYVDKDQLLQAIDNLISNAIDVTPPGRSLYIATGKVHEKGIDYVTLSVTDTGPGIPPNITERIFEPFYSTKKIGLGTGLGLAIVRKIMMEHHGMVRLKTAPGVGTCFTLFFPLQNKEEDLKTPCWETMGCGIAKDPARECPAYPLFGRICWAVAGSFAEGGARGICAAKLENCKECVFYQTVHSILPMWSGSQIPGQN